MLAPPLSKHHIPTYFRTGSAAFCNIELDRSLIAFEGFAWATRFSPPSACRIRMVSKLNKIYTTTTLQSSMRRLCDVCHNCLSPTIQQGILVPNPNRWVVGKWSFVGWPHDVLHSAWQIVVGRANLLSLAAVDTPYHSKTCSGDCRWHRQGEHEGALLTVGMDKAGRRTAVAPVRNSPGRSPPPCSQGPISPFGITALNVCRCKFE